MCMVIVWQGMVEVLDPVTKHKVRCYQTIRCSGATGMFQKHNFEGLWVLSADEEVCDGYVHYEHRTPNRQVVHLFHVHSTYGGGARWVMGPVAGNENGGAFVDTTATHPELILEKWTVWMESSWEECRLLFRGVVGEESISGAPLSEENEDEDDDVTGPATGSSGAKKNGIDAKKKIKKGGGTFTGVVGGAMAKLNLGQPKPLLPPSTNAQPKPPSPKPIAKSPSRLSVLETVIKKQSTPNNRRPSRVPSGSSGSTPPPRDDQPFYKPPPPRNPRGGQGRRPSLVLPQGLTRATLGNL